MQFNRPGRTRLATSKKIGTDRLLDQDRLELDEALTHLLQVFDREDGVEHLALLAVCITWKKSIPSVGVLKQRDCEEGTYGREETSPENYFAASSR